MKVHIALAVEDLAASVAEYEKTLGVAPELVIPDTYALFRTPSLNFSLRKSGEKAGTLRHLGFEDPDAESFSVHTDGNGVVWERFSAKHQADEIESAWPGTGYVPKRI